MSTIRQLTRELRKHGFTLEYFNRQRVAPTITTRVFRKQIDKRRTVNVQIQSDGVHRALHWIDNCMNTTPTDFADIASMLKAIKHESTRTDNKEWRR